MEKVRKTEQLDGQKSLPNQNRTSDQWMSFVEEHYSPSLYQLSYQETVTLNEDRTHDLGFIGPTL